MRHQIQMFTFRCIFKLEALVIDCYGFFMVIDHCNTRTMCMCVRLFVCMYVYLDLGLGLGFV